MTQIEQQLETFRVNFPYTRLFVWDDMITYKITPEYANGMTAEANKLIQDLNLNLLLAESDASSFIFRNVLRIKAK